MHCSCISRCRRIIRRVVMPRRTASSRRAASPLFCSNEQHSTGSICFAPEPVADAKRAGHLRRHRRKRHKRAVTQHTARRLNRRPGRPEMLRVQQVRESSRRHAEPCCFRLHTESRQRPSFAQTATQTQSAKRVYRGLEPRIEERIGPLDTLAHCVRHAATCAPLYSGGDDDSDIRRMPDVKIGKSTRLNSSHPSISYAVFCLKKKTPTW